MNKVIVLVAALMLEAAMASVAHAAPGRNHPFLKGVTSPADLAARIETSLTKNNPEGTDIIDQALCLKGKGCASPLDYLEMFQQSNPKAGLTTVAQIPDFLRSLQVAPAPPGVYWLACLQKIVPEGKRMFRPVLHCVQRRLKPGEKVWIDAKTRRIVLASDCTNPVEKEIPPEKCAIIRVFTNDPKNPPATGMRSVILGPDPVRDDCIAVKRASEDEFENWWPNECADARCDFSEDARFMGQPVQRVGSYAPVPGEHIFRVPASFAEKDSPYVVAFCLERGEFGSIDDPPKKPVEPSAPIPGEDPHAYAMKFIAYIEFLHAYESWKVALNAWRDRYIIWRDQWIAGHSDSINVVWYGYQRDASGTMMATVYARKEDVPPGKPVIYFAWGEYATAKK